MLLCYINDHLIYFNRNKKANTAHYQRKATELGDQHHRFKVQPLWLPIYVTLNKTQFHEYQFPHLINEVHLRFQH